MKKFTLRTASISVIALYIFTVSFSLLRNNNPKVPSENMIVTYVEPNDAEKVPTNFEYFAEAFNKIFKTIAAVDKAVRG